MSRRRPRLLSVFLLAIAGFLGTLALAPVSRPATPGRAECRSVPSKILGHEVAYCIILPPSYDTEKGRRYPVLYFLHGLGENSQLLINSGGMNLINDLWAKDQIGEFLIVAPDGGRSFYVNSRDGQVRYEDFFIREFIPYIESHYRIHAKGSTRGITGVSMGGYGALRFAFRYPQMFSSVSAHSALLIEKLPTAGVPDSQGALLARILGGAFGSPLDVGYWNKNNPFTLARSGPRPAGLKIYFDCGTEDDFGFDAGARQFHELLDSRGVPNEFHLYPGAHDWSYVAEHFPASLEFHSRAFGLTLHSNP